MQIYKQPVYYEIAFGFIDPNEQVDNFERIIDKFSKIKVRRFLDIACGPSLQLREIARRGYEAVGLDSASEMLEYLSKKAREEDLKIETIQADMCNFKLKRKADFAFIMMGSLDVESNERFMNHFDSVAYSLKRGGLYFIQNKVIDWTRAEEETWVIEKAGITVETTVKTHWKNMINQIYAEKITFEVDDHGQKTRIQSETDLKFIFPQELKTLIELNGKFEFLGWWEGNCNAWYLDQPLEKAESLKDNMVLLRRK